MLEKRQGPLDTNTHFTAGEPVAISIDPIRISNRLRAVLPHVPYYSFQGAARLAYDVGVARSTISRLLRLQHNPSYQTASGIAQAISMRFGKPVDLRELFTTDGTYPTPSACRLMHCPNCLPSQAWCEHTDMLKPAWRYARPGQWATHSPKASRPRGKTVDTKQSKTMFTEKLEDRYRLEAMESVHPEGRLATI